MNKYNFYLTIIFIFFLRINNSFDKLTNDIPNNYEFFNKLFEINSELKTPKDLTSDVPNNYNFLNELFRFNKIDLFKKNNKSLSELKEFIKNLNNNSYRKIQ